MSEPDSVELLRHDHVSLAARIGAIISEQAAIRSEVAGIKSNVADTMSGVVLLRTNMSDVAHSVVLLEKLGAKQDEIEDERSARIEKSVDEIRGYFKWFCITVGSGIILAATGFMVRGGFSP